MKLTYLATILATALLSSQSFAANIQTLSCKVRTEAERTDDTETKSVSFDAAKETKDLNFAVYGSKVNVTITSYMKELKTGEKECGEQVDQICAASSYGNYFCTTSPQAVLYPKNAEPGDRTTITCRLTGVTKHACNLK